MKLRHLFPLFVALPLHAEVISTKALTQNEPIRITIATGVYSTIRFPEPVNAVIGYGIGQAGNGNAPALVEAQRPQGSPLLAFRALQPNAHVLATVIVGQAMYVLDLQAGQNPDVAVTMTKGGGNGPDFAPRAVSAHDVVAMRPKLDDQRLIGLVKRAQDAALLKPDHPDLYQGYAMRRAEYTCDCGDAKTLVTEVHRFSNEDATVISGWVTNATDKPISFDGRNVTVRVASEVHPSRLFIGQRPIPAGKSVRFWCVIQGGIDGISRANLDIGNEYRVEIPPVDGKPVGLWGLKNGFPPRSPVAIAKPAEAPTIPRAQTGQPVRD